MKMFPVRFYHQRARIFGVLMAILVGYLMVRAVWDYFAK
jgi:hypothetical protein